MEVEINDSFIAKIDLFVYDYSIQTKRITP